MWPENAGPQAAPRYLYNLGWIGLVLGRHSYRTDVTLKSDRKTKLTPDTFIETRGKGPSGNRAVMKSPMESTPETKSKDKKRVAFENEQNTTLDLGPRKKKSRMSRYHNNLNCNGIYHCLAEWKDCNHEVYEDTV